MPARPRSCATTFRWSSAVGSRLDLDSRVHVHVYVWVIVVIELAQGPGCRAAHRTNLVALRRRETFAGTGVLDFAERPCGGRAHILVAVLQRRQQGLDCRAVLDLTQGPRAQRAHVRIGVLERRRERWNRTTVFDLPQRPDGRLAHLGDGIAQQRFERADALRTLDFPQRPGSLLPHAWIAVLRGRREHRHRGGVLDFTQRPDRAEPHLHGLIVERGAQWPHRARILDLAQCPCGRPAHFQRAIVQRARQGLDRDFLFDFAECPGRGHPHCRAVIATHGVAERTDRARILELPEPECAGFAEVRARIAQQCEEQVVGTGVMVIAEDACGDVANAAIVVANHGAEGAQHGRVHVAGPPVHGEVDSTAATTARHRHGRRHRLRHGQARLTERMPPEAPVVGQRFASERANRRVARAELVQYPRDGRRVEGRAVLRDEQQGSKQRHNHETSWMEEAPGWIAPIRERLPPREMPVLSRRVPPSSVVLCIICLIGCARAESSRPAPPPPPQARGPAGPADSLIPAGPYGDAVRRGRALLTATRDSLPTHVANKLRCTSCHLDEGRRENGTWIGVFARYPQYRARSGMVETIEYRINDCFRRSMNGTALDPAGADMRDIVTYLAFLSRGVDVRPPTPSNRLQKWAAFTADTVAGARV